MIAVLRDRDVSISPGEGFTVRAGADIRDRAADLEIMAELGAQRVNTVSLDPDLAHSCDQFGILAELAAAVGVETTVEFSPELAIPDLPTALHAIRVVGRPDFRLLIDTMHLIRSGSSADDIAAIDPDLIGYVQLSDAPLAPTIPSYMEEAMFERMAPGTGELPLLDVLGALPPNLVIGLEVPIRSEAEAGIGPRPTHPIRRRGSQAAGSDRRRLKGPFHALRASIRLPQPRLCRDRHGGPLCCRARHRGVG
jgi:sugar phosphate isomerase/epimerase